MKPLQLGFLAVVFTGVISAQAPTISGCPIFPANNVWNTPIDTLPVHPNSAAYINSISPTAGFHYDMTFPLNIVPGTQPKVPLNIAYPDESDPGPYPIPPNAGVENGGDLHVIVLDKDNCILYETYNSVLQADGSWNVDSAAKWSLTSNALRPAGWTSADAAGLPMLPGFLRYDEVLSGQINHALRFTAPQTQRLYVWPGRHYASQNTSPSLPPMGQRFRLKASFDISGFSPNIQVILRALKKYGMFLADNGLPWYLQGVSDSRWNTTELDTLRSIVGSNIEAVDESSLMINVDSGQAAQPGVVAVTVAPTAVTLGASQSQQFTASVSGSSLGVVWSLSPQVGTVSSNGLYTAPSSVTGAQTVAVNAALTDGSKSASAVVTLQPAAAPSLASVAVSPTSVNGGSNVSVTVTLTGAAPAGGAAVSLTGSNAAFPSATVTIAAGSVFQTFGLPTSVVTATTAVTITASYAGSSATSSTLTVNAASLPPTGAASFLKTDSTTSGTWRGVYGGDGYDIVNDGVSVPSYVTVTPSLYLLNTWAASTTDPRGLQKVTSSTDRIAACWYSGNFFTVDLTFKDANTHQVALYMVDWDSGNRRVQRIDVVDGNGTPLDSRTVSTFGNGQYLVWNLSGHVIIRITNTGYPNAVLDAIFFGGASAPAAPLGTAAFLKTDTATSGSWKGVYGADGYNVINDTANYPAYVTVTPGSVIQHTWAASTTDPRGLQKAASTTDRIASCWYQWSSFTVDVSFKDTAAHQVALYVVDWDGNNGRAERIDILDPNNNVLDSRNVTAFSSGQYLVWNLSGHVVIRLTNTGSPNVVLSGIFFGGGGGGSVSANTAAFVKTDTTTSGSWKGVYGADGFNVINDTASYPAYVAVTPGAVILHTWAASTSDPRGLQKASSTTDRIASCWYQWSSFTMDVKFADANSHQVALYIVDWDGNNSRAERIDILDPNNNVLDSRTASAFGSGQYLVWNLTGHVTIRLTNTGSPNVVLSGMFFR